MINVFKQISDIDTYLKNNKNLSVGFVPTMGALHDGHMSLIRASKNKADLTIVSIFVNPAQFNNKKDFETYPNLLPKDLELLTSLEVDAVFTPTESEIYPNGYHFKMTENLNSLGLCGSSRPGHFDGVLTVLLKLFNIVKPKYAFMGLKDYQQYYLVKKMVEDVFLDIQIIGVETVREQSGLALSSRNLNLTKDQRRIADQYATLFSLEEPIDILKSKINELDLKLDYLETRWGRKLISVYIGDVRLIDNREYNGQ